MTFQVNYFPACQEIINIGLLITLLLLLLNFLMNAVLVVAFRSRFVRVQAGNYESF